MLDRLSVGVQLVDVDSSDSRILRIVVEQIQKIHVRPDIIADGACSILAIPCGYEPVRSDRPVRGS
jgi:hypothetical protein